METTFSNELKQLIANSRDLAIDLGNDHISTLHFFLADCESGNHASILNFAFKNREDYLSYKKSITPSEIHYLDQLLDSLPLTKEAEATIIQTEIERQQNRQAECYPFHFFIAALKIKSSVLAQGFQKDQDACEKLTRYYKELGEFERSKLSEEQPIKKWKYKLQKEEVAVLNTLYNFARKAITRRPKKH